MKEDIRSILKSDDRLNNEAIEKLVSIQKELEKHYAFADAAIPVDVFKPNASKIKNMKDAVDYFENSVDLYHKFENHSYLSELWEWFEVYADQKVDSDQNKNLEFGWEISFLSDWECHHGNYYTEIEVIYAKKLIALPYEYICNNFILWGDDHTNPLQVFFIIFDEWFYARGIDQNFTIDWEKVRRFYELNIIRQNLS
ncbi:hypothetical protein N8Z97_00395 [Gammaproteobacteria bacterium]|nr:hypothetical protein [Gammaproteobacteria bacterium]